MSIQYGAAPTDLGHFDLDIREHLLYLYLPIKLPGDFFWYPNLPKRLHFAFDVIDAAVQDFKDSMKFEHRWRDDIYVYLTAKTMWVEPGCPGNRPGWHADGYGSDGDLNYIWYDMNPTEFAVQSFRDIPTDDLKCLAALEDQVSPEHVVRYDTRRLLRLDERVVHRVNPNPRAGLRTFVKVSVSRHKYNLKGNSHNYLIDYDWEMHDRIERRNVDNKDFVA